MIVIGILLFLILLAILSPEPTRRLVGGILRLASGFFFFVALIAAMVLFVAFGLPALQAFHLTGEHAMWGVVGFIALCCVVALLNSKGSGEFKAPRQ